MNALSLVTGLVRATFHSASIDDVFSECQLHSSDLSRTTDCSSLPAINRQVRKTLDYKQIYEYSVINYFVSGE